MKKKLRRHHQKAFDLIDPERLTSVFIDDDGTLDERVHTLTLQVIELQSLVFAMLEGAAIDPAQTTPDRPRS